jgi:hypothetical protein
MQRLVTVISRSGPQSTRITGDSCELISDGCKAAEGTVGMLEPAHEVEPLSYDPRMFRKQRSHRRH